MLGATAVRELSSPLTVDESDSHHFSMEFIPIVSPPHYTVQPKLCQHHMEKGTRKGIYIEICYKMYTGLWRKEGRGHLNVALLLNLSICFK